MDEEGHTTPCERRHHASQRSLIDGGELCDAGRHEKALEAADASIDERLDLAVVVGYDAAPERDVDMAASLSRCSLRRERRHSGRRRNAVERHVDDGGDAACCCRACRGVETLPVGAAGI